MIGPELLGPDELPGLLVEALQPTGDAGREQPIADDERRRVRAVAHARARRCGKSSAWRAPTASCRSRRSRRSRPPPAACHTSCRGRHSRRQSTSSRLPVSVSRSLEGRTGTTCPSSLTPRSGNPVRAAPLGPLRRGRTWRGRRGDLWWRDLWWSDLFWRDLLADRRCGERECEECSSVHAAGLL